MSLARTYITLREKPTKSDLAKLTLRRSGSDLNATIMLRFPI